MFGWLCFGIYWFVLLSFSSFFYYFFFALEIGIMELMMGRGEGIREADCVCCSVKLVEGEAQLGGS